MERSPRKVLSARDAVKGESNRCTERRRLRKDIRRGPAWARSLPLREDLKSLDQLHSVSPKTTPALGVEGAVRSAPLASWQFGEFGDGSAAPPGLAVKWEGRRPPRQIWREDA